MKTKFTMITDATVELKTGDTSEKAVLTDLGSLPALTRFRIFAAIPLEGFLYAVLLDPNDYRVTVVFPAGDAPDAVSAGDHVVLPDEDNWLEAPSVGQLRLVVAAAPVSATEWAELGGRDGQAHRTGNSDGSVEQSDPSKSTQPTSGSSGA
jgi:hypothetical protein